uniref:Uncharacterized protein n=1 Tax=Ananas comosus var. bracteatus TaxID=296719 RepID=A0A6V7Q9K2_ANACO|nr:unnamed protein product [Ananas comosus var. bracteatus]
MEITARGLNHYRGVCDDFAAGWLSRLWIRQPRLTETIAGASSDLLVELFPWVAIPTGNYGVGSHPTLFWGVYSFYSRGPVPGRRDRSPSEQCCGSPEATGPWRTRPVPERVYAVRDRSRAGRDRFPNVGFSGSQRETGPCWERPVPLGENCPDRADPILDF